MSHYHSEFLLLFFFLWLFDDRLGILAVPLVGLFDLHAAHGELVDGLRSRNNTVQELVDAILTKRSSHGSED